MVSDTTTMTILAMPELPEMETYRRLLMDKIVGKQISSVEINREKSINMPEDLFKQEVTHQIIYNVERRAKHLLFHLSSGKRLLLHLMLGGFMFYGMEREKPDRSVQVSLSFGDEKLYFIGLRLGYLHVLTHVEAAERLSHLGPEPLSSRFTLPVLTKLAMQRRGILKTALVDQSFLSGIGNCYADEICFHAGLSPKRKWSDLKPEDITRLYNSILFILKEAIHYGGYMDSPLFLEDELTGGYDSLCKVYDREGEPCFRCGNSISKEIISSRKVFYCGQCQQ